jgi:hypothetical protein
VNNAILKAFLLCLCSPSLCVVLFAAERVNPHAALISDFEQRVAAYIKLHNQAASDSPQLKTTESAEKIAQHEHELAARIRKLRATAKQGDIFTPAIRTEFRRLIKMADEGTRTSEIHRTLNHAEPVHLHLHVNDAYPTSVPLQSTPATLLRNLPALPKQLEYRVIDHNLILRDIGADLVVDFAEQVVP